MKNVIPKTPEALAKIRAANQLAASILERITPQVQPGVTTEALNAQCQTWMEEAGATPAPLLEGFPKAICTSLNHVICHGIPQDKPLKKTDILNIDVSLRLDGYCGDTSKMFTLGQPSVLAQRLIDVTQQCLYAAIALVKPGARLGDIGHTIESLATDAGFSVVRDYCGHGIGETLHEPPQVMHYGRAGSGLVLEPGMTFTIEPMINAGSYHARVLSDRWTVVTKDRSLSAQWEHAIAVTEQGCEVLSKRPGEPF